MKRCKTCGWWFEPKTNRSMYCDDECRREGMRESWNKSRKKRADKEKARKVLKVDAQKLPVPMLPPTKKVESTDYKLQKLFEMMERRRAFEG